MEQIVQLLEVDKPDHKGVIYPLSVIEDGINDFNKRNEERGGMLGECGIPVDLDPLGQRLLDIDLVRSSHIVKHVWLDNAVVKAKLFLLGKYAEIAEQLNIDFLAIPRAYGDIDEKTKICTKYTLITVDLILPE